MDEDITSVYIMLSLIPLAIIIVAIILLIKKAFSSPFKYPYYMRCFDVFGKRLPKIDDYIEQFICDGGFAEIEKHNDKITKWHIKCEEYIDACVFKSLRRRQYLDCKDDEHAYIFHFVRNRDASDSYLVPSENVQYLMTMNCYTKVCDYTQLLDTYRKLSEIGFETTLSKYHSKEQRKLMTREFRESIMLRDNYTCQICGKYMPDEVGLQIDHIVPVSKGGKSIRSNLQVLCSKCNGHKSDKK